MSRTWDIVARDAEGREILVGAVKARYRLDPEEVSEILGALSETNPTVPFGLIADLDEIRLVRFGEDGQVETVRSLPTADVVRRYDPEFGQGRIFKDYLETLVIAWLRDLNYHWKSAEPPGAGPLRELGLLPRLEGGFTRSEVPVGADPLR